MKKHIILISLLSLTLGGCGFFEDEKAPANAAKGAASAKEKPVAVKYDPAFKDIAGTWVSEAGTVGENRMLRIDIASGGGYSIDVRIPGSPEQVVETGRGNAKSNDAGIAASPTGDLKSPILKGLGSWTADVTEKTTMSLKGADGKTVTLSYKGL